MTARGRRPIVVLATAVTAALALTSCSGSGQGLARQACAHVDRSLQLYQRSQDAPTKAQAAADYAAAVGQLSLAQPDAALAASQDGQWQALMTTISESPRVPMNLLVHALTVQCAATSSPGGAGA